MYRHVLCMYINYTILYCITSTIYTLQPLDDWLVHPSLCGAAANWRSTEAGRPSITSYGSVGVSYGWWWSDGWWWLIVIDGYDWLLLGYLIDLIIDESTMLERCQEPSREVHKIRKVNSQRQFSAYCFLHRASHSPNAACRVDSQPPILSLFFRIRTLSNKLIIGKSLIGKSQPPFIHPQHPAIRTLSCPVSTRVILVWPRCLGDKVGRLCSASATCRCSHGESLGAAAITWDPWQGSTMP